MCGFRVRVSAKRRTSVALKRQGAVPSHPKGRNPRFPTRRAKSSMTLGVCTESSKPFACAGHRFDVGAARPSDLSWDSLPEPDRAGRAPEAHCPLLRETVSPPAVCRRSRFRPSARSSDAPRSCFAAWGSSPLAPSARACAPRTGPPSGRILGRGRSPRLTALRPVVGRPGRDRLAALALRELSAGERVGTPCPPLSQCPLF